MRTNGDYGGSADEELYKDKSGIGGWARKAILFPKFQKLPEVSVCGS